jgi:cyclic di-GMP phosphodiesterase Gmr
MIISKRMIEHAIAEGEINLHFQPICCLATGELQGFESLARWDNIKPGLFLPLIDKFDLQLPLIRKQIGQIEFALSRFNLMGLNNIWVSLNVGRKTLEVDSLEGLLNSTTWPNQIQIEILESVTLNAKDMEVLSKIKGKHTIKADDIGAKGYDSFARFIGEESAYIDGIKIDGPLVTAMPKNARALAVVRLLLNLAKECNLNTTAEWVETEEVRYILIREGCQLGQGYLFGKPMPLIEALEFAKQN